MKFRLGLLALSLTSLAAVNAANAMEVTGEVTADVPVTQASMRATLGETQPVTLMSLKLNQKELKSLNSVRRTLATRKSLRQDSLPESADAGMNGTPVLNQGRHGSCVTFATTGALDALIGKGDYISQLCSLELGSYLQKNAYTYSGWNGSFGPLVISQLMTHGVVSMKTQAKKGCAGVKEYPATNASDTGKPISVDAYHKLSENLSRTTYWEPILSVYQFSFDEYDHEYNSENVLNEVKKTIAIKREGRNARVTFGIIIPYQMCRVGACATNHAANDTWALTKSMEREFSNWELAGHEMIITAYDDNAVVTDNEGGTHTGVLTLRNSWGTSTGYEGNYYMTYDFFKRFVMEAQRLVKMDPMYADDDQQRV